MFKIRQKLLNIGSPGKNPSGKKRRGSLQVNLSYTIDLSDEENIDDNDNNLSVIMSQSLSQLLANMDKKDEALNESTSRLREAILNKTREVFNLDDNDNMRQKTGSALHQSQAPSNTQKSSPVLRSSNNCNIEKHKNESRKQSQIYYPKISRTQKSNNFQDESLVLAPPVISSTFCEKQCAIHESCNTSKTSQSLKRSCTTNQSPPKRQLRESIGANRPKICQIQPCHVELKKFDGYSTLNRSKTILKDVPMELTNCVQNVTHRTGHKPGPKFTHERKKNSRVQKTADSTNLPTIVENDSDPRHLDPSMYVNTSLDGDLTCDGDGGPDPSSDSDSDGTISNLERLRNVSQSKTRSLAKKKQSDDEPDIVEASPKPSTKSTLLRSQIKHNSTQHSKSRDVSSIRARREQLLSKTSEVLEKTLVVADVHQEQNYRRNIIEDSDPEEEPPSTPHDTSGKGGKKKLFTQHDSPGRFVSFSPVSSTTPTVSQAKKRIKRPRIRRNLAGQILNPQVRSQAAAQPSQAPSLPMPTRSQPPSTSDSSQETVIRDVEKRPKKKRPIKSKKIVVKNKLSRNVLTDSNDEQDRSVNNRRSSQAKRKSGTFMDRKTILKNRSFDRRMVIVATGLNNGDKETIKKAVKQLGGATVEAVVSRKTTHVVTTGGRTINLLRGIIRGCWIVNFDWVLKSMEVNQWQSTENFEIEHVSKVVRENRRDREVFGRHYVPDLFTTCDLVYIERQTNPPQDQLKELFKIAGGRIIEDAKKAKVIVGPGGVREHWILDSITMGELQPMEQYLVGT